MCTLSGTTKKQDTLLFKTFLCFISDEHLFTCSWCLIVYSGYSVIPFIPVFPILFHVLIIFNLSHYSVTFLLHVVLCITWVGFIAFGIVLLACPMQLTYEPNDYISMMLLPSSPCATCYLLLGGSRSLPPVFHLWRSQTHILYSLSNPEINPIYFIIPDNIQHCTTSTQASYFVSLYSFATSSTLHQKLLLKYHETF